MIGERLPVDGDLARGQPGSLSLGRGDGGIILVNDGAVAIQGGRAAMQRGSKIIRPASISIRVGKPIETAGLSLDDRDELIGRVRSAIEALLAEGPIGDA